MARSAQLPQTLESELTLDRASGAPLGAQLTQRLERLVEGGRLKPGEQLPSVRQLAEAADVNVNTVRSVYAGLEQRGLLRSEHGRGTFVAGGPVTPDDASDDREYRRELTRQIAELERQASYYTRHRIVGAADRPRRPPAGQLLTLGDLIGVRDDLLEHVERLRHDEEERLRLVEASRAALESERLAERAAEIEAAGRRRRGTAADPPQIVSGAGAWILRWRS